MIQFKTLLEVPYTERGISYSCGEFLKNMPADFSVPELFAPYASVSSPGFTIKPALPSSIGRVVWKSYRAGLRRYNERRFSRSLESTEGIAYLFGETSFEFSEWIAAHGICVSREKVNTSKEMTKQILAAEYGRLGLPNPHHVSQTDIDLERRRLRQADFVFCASPFVEQSMIDYGIPADRLINTERGFDPSRLVYDGAPREHDKPTFLFVGTLCIRKGVHRLLDAWKKAGVDGTLLLVGHVEKDFQALYYDQIDGQSIRHIRYTDDIAELYRQADAFVLPSFEEGSPKVVYEAAYCGLPALVSPMGAGRVTQHMVGGMIIDPLDAEQWVAAIRQIASDPDLRARMGTAAHESSQAFTWGKVAQRRWGELARRYKARSQTRSFQSAPVAV